MTNEELLAQSAVGMNQALTIAKYYIDQKSGADRAYADTALATALQTTNLTEKLALLEQINGILDGDNATAGFQAWQNNVAQLGALVTGLGAANSNITTLQGNVTTVNAALTSLSTTLGQRVTDEVAALNATISSKDAATNTRIDTLASNIAADKIAQVQKDAQQSADIAANGGAISSVVTSLQAEATTRAAADAAFNTRATAAESAISALQAGTGDFATKAQVVSVFASMATIAETVFGLNAQGQATGGGAVI